MRRPQFSLKTLLWLMAVVAAFLGGMAAQAQFDQPAITRIRDCGTSRFAHETMTTRDGKLWGWINDDGTLVSVPITKD